MFLYLLDSMIGTSNVTEKKPNQQEKGIQFLLMSIFIHSLELHRKEVSSGGTD